jgi:Nuclear transport factor 2 (NTF2) domain
MAAVNAELLAVVERSPAATDVHDRTGWLGLFSVDARVEDPYGSRAHVGIEEIGRFYDTFVAPRQIIFHRDVDLAVGPAVVRDLMLEIVMGAGVTLNVPMHLRYDLRPSDGDWQIERLRAHWELPTMVGQMLRQGTKTLPVALRLGGELLRNQGIGGTAGFAVGLRRPGRRQKGCAETLLDAAVAGDELTARRVLTCGAVVSIGDDDPIAVGEFVDRLRGGRWLTLIAAGDTVSASVSTPSGRGVVFCEMARATRGITGVRYFA